ncbi:hypothetical protein ABE67_09605 [Cytobacillus firmus]|nr:hypothetical protein [Cytobacillus firmus]
MILENADAFSSCGDHSRKLIQCPAGGEGAGDPAGEAEELCSSPRKATGRIRNLKLILFIFKDRLTFLFIGYIVI